jgi:hypothetical protein
MDEPVTRTWWQRNAVALGIVVVIAPITAAAISLNAWQGINAAHPVTVAQGEAIAYGDAEVGPLRARFDDLEGIPRGTRVVAVEIDIDPDGEEFTCSSPTLIETTALHREWIDATTSIDRPYDPDRVTYCDRELTGPYTVEFDYLVPDDAVGPFVLEFASPDAAPDVLELTLSP